MAEEEEEAPPPEPEEEAPPPAEEAPEPAGEGQDATAEKYTISKVQIKPGKQLSSKKDATYPTQLPALPSKPADYTPMPYTFRVPTPSSLVKINNLLAQSPPFHLLLDHTIAVIWMIFSTGGEFNGPLGINQLQWASAFLKTVHTSIGDYPPDVRVCIEAIEAMLIEMYADLSEDMKAINRINETVRYSDGAFGSCTMVTESFPFSLNYSEIVDRVSGEGRLVPTVSMTSAEAEEELDKIKKAAGVDDIENLGAAAKEQAAIILKMWKMDQIEKVKLELRRLRSIEDKMRDLDDQYVEDDIEALAE